MCVSLSKTCSLVPSGSFCAFSLRLGGTGGVGGGDRGLARAGNQGRGRHGVRLPLAPQQSPDRASLSQRPRSDSNTNTPWICWSSGGGLGCCPVGGGCGFLLPGAEHVSSGHRGRSDRNTRRSPSIRSTVQSHSMLQEIAHADAATSPADLLSFSKHQGIASICSASARTRGRLSPPPSSNPARWDSWPQRLRRVRTQRLRPSALPSPPPASCRRRARTGYEPRADEGSSSSRWTRGFTWAPLCPRWGDSAWAPDTDPGGGGMHIAHGRKRCIDMPGYRRTMRRWCCGLRGNL